MKQLVRYLPLELLLVLAGALFPGPATAAERFDDSAVQHIDYPDWFADSPFHDLQEELHTAVTENRQGLMVLFTTAGCAYCAAFIRKSLGNPEIAERVQKDFAAVGLEIFDDAEMTGPRGGTLAIKAFAEREGAAPRR